MEEIHVIRTMHGSPDGRKTQWYEAGKDYAMTPSLASTFKEQGWGHPVGQPFSEAELAAKREREEKEATAHGVASPIAAIAAKDGHIGALNATIDAKDGHIGALSATADALKASLEAKDAQIAALKTKIAALNATIAEKDGQIFAQSARAAAAAAATSGAVAPPSEAKAAK